jgi:murein L,D-transpeptidase YafK
MRNFPAVAYLASLTLFLVLLESCHPHPEPIVHLDTDLSQLDKSTSSILIDKSEYTLTLLAKGKPVKTWPVVFGFNATDDKRREGDGCTPEGHFKVKKAYPHAKWNYFIWVDYPTEESWRLHNAAKAKGEIPADATIGGEIGIHGVPDGNNALIDTQTNWTLGCISMKNDAVAELFSAIDTGTPIEIRK